MLIVTLSVRDLGRVKLRARIRLSTFFLAYNLSYLWYAANPAIAVVEGEALSEALYRIVQRGPGLG